VPPPPSFNPVLGGTQMAPSTPPPPPPPAVAVPLSKPASVFNRPPVGAPLPAKPANAFTPPPVSAPPPAQPASSMNQAPAGAPISRVPRPPYRPPRRYVPPAQSLPPASVPPKKSNTGWIIGGCAAVVVILIIIVVVVIVALRSGYNKVTSIVTPVAKMTQSPKTPDKTATPATKAVSKTNTPGKAATPATKAVSKTVTPSTKAATVVAVNAAGIATGAWLLADDFSNPNSGWDTSAGDNFNVGYVNGTYVIEVTGTDSFAWGNAGKAFSDFVLEIDTTKQAGPDNNGFGVILRYQDPGNFYTFDISSYGNYEFGYYQNDTWTSIISWTGSSDIKQGNATNTITIQCKGNKFTFYVNGTKIADATDSTFSSGDIGLWAGAFSDAGVKIVFDRLAVWKTK
jgi:hypothetical protein